MNTVNMKNKKILFILGFVVFGLALSVSAVIINQYNKLDTETYFANPPEKKITRGDIDKLKIGMSFEEVIDILGRPQRDEASGAISFTWDLNKSEKLVAYFERHPQDLISCSSESEFEIIMHTIYMYNYMVVDR